MGLKSSRPLPQAKAELQLVPFFRKCFRVWHLDHVRLVLVRYRSLTKRFCVDSLQLSTILGMKDDALLRELMQMFLPRTPTRVQCMVDAMEIMIALVLVCQAPSMLSRFEAIFDIMDADQTELLTSADLVALFGAVTRAMMKLFNYGVEPDHQTAMRYINDVLHSGICGASGGIGKHALCRFMLSDRLAVHYVKQCTGEDKPKLYIMMEKDTEFIGAIEFSHLQHLQTSSLKAVRDMIMLQIDRVPSDFTFLCQGREINRVWEVDRRAWSIIPFALRGSPGLRANAAAKNRRHERPSQVNRFEFRYMNNLLPRYKKRVQEIAPVYRHRSYHLSSSGTTNALQPSVKWHVASNWSGEWVYDQTSLCAKKKIQIQQRLRAAAKPDNGSVIVKNHFGVLMSPINVDGCTELDLLATTAVTVPPNMQLLADRKQEVKLQGNRVRWKARMLAMAAVQKRENRLKGARAKRNVVRQASLVSNFDETPHIIVVHIETNEYILPSRLVETNPKKRKRSRELSKIKHDLNKGKPVQQSLKSHLDVTLLEKKMVLLPPAGVSESNPIQLGCFMCSTNICLENDEVEVFPVVIIRPIEEKVIIQPLQITDGTSDIRKSAFDIEDIKSKRMQASKSYLSKFEYEISVSESNYEALFQHIGGNRMQNAFELCRRDIFGRTMLHDTAEFGHAHVMELLLKTRVLLNVTDSRGNAPLHYAAKNGHLKEVSLLLRDNATSWILNHEGKSPLYYALETAARQQHRELIKSGDGQKNFLVANHKYSKLRQVIDLLWDKYPIEKLLDRDVYDWNCCLDLEKQVYGDLFNASQQGNLLRVQRLIDLEKHAPAHYVNDHMDTLRRTALHEAVEQGHTAIVDILLKIGSDGYLKDQSNQVPLHIAARNGFERIVKCLLLKFPRAVGHQDCLGKTPLHLAIENKHWVIALDLISAMKGEHMSFNEHDVKIDTTVLLLDTQDIHGYTALHFACIFGQVEICTALLDAQASPVVSRCEFIISSYRKPLFGHYLKRPPPKSSKYQLFELCEGQYTSVLFDIEEPLECVLRACKLHSERFAQYLDLLKLLLERRKIFFAVPRPTKRVKCLSPELFHLAAEIAHVNVSIAIEACRILSKYHIEINSVHSQSGDTVLLQECKRLCLVVNGTKKDSSASLELVHTLIELGSNVNLPNETNGDTPLGCSAWYGHLQLLELLLEAGADRDFFMKQGSYSALHFAALGANLTCAAKLLGSNASINVSTSPLNEETPLFFAVRSGSIAMVEMLLKHGADALALCTVEPSKSTSFGILLDIQLSTNISTHRMGRCKKILMLSQSQVLSPLTFGLYIAQPLAPFGALEQPYDRKQELKNEEWKRMDQICLSIARHILASDPQSTAKTGWITSEDIYLSCLLGYWELADMLLSRQIVLSSAASSATMNALHLASAAGKTSVVTALVSAGMNVNCNFEPVYPVALKRQLTTQKVITTIRPGYVNRTDVGIFYRYRGPLYFSLINGHIDTAAKLLVLGAKPQETLPHTAKKAIFKRAYGEVVKIEFVTFYVEEAMRQKEKVHLLQFRRSFSEAEEIASIHFVRHLEHSINANVPLLRLEVELGNLNLVKILVDAGMNIFDCVSPFIPNSLVAPREERQTPIHYAVTRGHLELVKYFAKIARYDFVKCFQRESQKPKGLLVSACETHRKDVLLFLLSQENPSSSKKIISGGFTYEENGDEFQQALNASARANFAAGFSILLECGARPDLETLACVLASISSAPRWYRKDCLPCHSLHNLREESCTFSEDALMPRRATRYSQSAVEIAYHLLHMILPFTGNLILFFRKSLSFDRILQVMIGCARFQFWFMLEQLFVDNESQFVNPSSKWKPIILRAASCCSVLHCAAASNQVRIVKFLLAIGVPADLQLSEMPLLKSPIWYAASRGCLDTFLALALKCHNFDKDLQISAYNSVNSVFRSSSSFSSFVIPGSQCKWQDIGVFGCFHVPKEQTRSILIQKYVSYAWRESQRQTSNSLLHSACSHGELLAVRVLVEAGANLVAINANYDTPLDIAARRKDSYGTAIVRFLVSALSNQQNLVEDGSFTEMMSRALVRCFAEVAPSNLKIAEVLLASGADTRFVDKTDRPHDGKFNEFGSALYYAMRSVQFSGVKLLLDHDALINVKATDVFLNQLVVQREKKLFWRGFAPYLRYNDQRLLEVESLMELILDKRFCQRALNEDLVHQLLMIAANLACTVSKRVGMEQRFWRIVSIILDRYPQDCRRKKATWGQKSGLHFAVLALQHDIVEKLLLVGDFDPISEDEDRQTPLHLVAINGDAPICGLLLQYVRHASRTIDTCDRHGRSALHCAVIHGHENVVKMLLHAGASMELRCSQGLNAFLYALKYDRLAVIIELYSHIAKDAVQARSIVFLPSGEHGIFLAAQHASFRVIRWFSSLNENTNAFVDELSLSMPKCRFGRTLLHYASISGDDEFALALIKQYENESTYSHGESLVNAKDFAGYTPALYALAFGRIRVLHSLAMAGADLSVIVDHSAEPKPHPYATSFDLSTLLQLFALPGWYAYASRYLPVYEKRCVIQDAAICETHHTSSCYRWRYVKRRDFIVNQRKLEFGTKFNNRSTKTAAQRDPRKRRMHTSMRSWRFPQMSLFDYLCDIGDTQLVSFLLNLPLPLLLYRSTYQSQRQNFLQAVRWNYLDMVEALLTATVTKSKQDILHFMDFLEVGIDCAVKRGLEQMALLLLSKWHGIKENGRIGADANVFAFQFAHVFQTACIRQMSALVEYMIQRGGQSLVEFQWNDGSALLYALAFGHSNTIKLLVDHGALITSHEAFVVPSLKKWVEFGCPNGVLWDWNRLAPPRFVAHTHEFVGPIEQYQPPSQGDRLSLTTIRTITTPAYSSTSSETVAEENPTANTEHSL